VQEAALVGRLRAGEPRAFEELVIAYQHHVFGVAVRMLGNRAEAEEVAQETFLRAHRALPEFRADSRLGTWLYAIASRLCLTRLASPHRRLARGDDAVLAAAAIAALPEERRIVVILRDVEGLTYEEIGEALGLEPGTVRSRLHRARMDLKAKLERFTS
jgi:RNA polymerase sigma-70 factor (ECF subfamily)